MKSRPAYSEQDILTPAEVMKIADRARDRATRLGGQWWTRLVVFELSCCLGLRASEIASLLREDVQLCVDRPYVFVRAEITKGSRHSKRARGRKVPADWSDFVVRDLNSYMGYREAYLVHRCGQTHMGKLPFVIPFHPISTRRGNFKLDRTMVYRAWVQAVKGIIHDPGRRHTHTGRHTFASQSLAAGFTLTQVSRALGHASESVTSRYLHPTSDADKRGRLFAQEGKP